MRSAVEIVSPSPRLSDEPGFTRSSAHRILDHLVQLRWLHRSGRDYTLGLRLVELGSLAVYQDRLLSAAHPHLYELHRRTGLIVEMTILDGSNVVCRAHMAGRFASMIPNRIGFSTRADGTLVGRVLHTFNNERGEAADEVRKTGVGYGRDTPIDGFGTIRHSDRPDRRRDLRAVDLRTAPTNAARRAELASHRASSGNSRFPVAKCGRPDHRKHASSVGTKTRRED